MLSWSRAPTKAFGCDRNAKVGGEEMVLLYVWLRGGGECLLRWMSGEVCCWRGLGGRLERFFVYESGDCGVNFRLAYS